MLGFKTIQSLCQFKFFALKFLYRFIAKKLLGFKVIQSLYWYFPLVIQVSVLHKSTLFSESRLTLNTDINLHIDISVKLSSCFLNFFCFNTYEKPCMPVYEIPLYVLVDFVVSRTIDRHIKESRTEQT